MKTRVKVSGLKESLDRLDKIAKESRYAAAATVVKFGDLAENLIDGEIVRQDIIDTGRLRRKVEANYTGNNKVTVTSIAEDERGYDYAPIQEYGGRHHPARPYFKPSIIRALKIIDEFVTELFEKITR